MKEFDYKIQDKLGIHVRPAGQLAQVVKEKPDVVVTISNGDKTADVTKLFAVMGLAVKCGDTVHITVEGKDEEIVANEVETFLKEHL